MDARPPLLYLVHRIPYPPNKGDKVRSFNILRELAKSYRVFLGTFIDHPDDEAYVERLREWCEDVHAVRIHPRLARLASLRGLLWGEALSLPYYRSTGMADWIGTTVSRHGIRSALAFSGPMAQYLDHPALACKVIDFCDVDSAKWQQYAGQHAWPLSWLYRREAVHLLAFERRAAAGASASSFVTDAEAGIFRREAPELAERILAIPNGVDAEYFAPATEHRNPYPDGGPAIVFTGAMDYWPNIDAVTWFSVEILPRIRKLHPLARFYIVGMNPAPAVTALAAEGVVVTGTVPDVRPWLMHADVVAAPLRVARGIQNKVLEAMAMKRPVVVSAAAATGLAGVPGEAYLCATSADDFAGAIAGLISDAASRARIGDNARACVLTNYSWPAHLVRFKTLLGQGDAPSLVNAAPECAGVTS